MLDCIYIIMLCVMLFVLFMIHVKNVGTAIGVYTASTEVHMCNVCVYVSYLWYSTDLI